MKKVLSIIGTRPEAIKMAPVIREFKRRSDEICSMTCLTGQHTTLLSGILDVFGIVPQYEMELSADQQTLPRMFAALVSKIDEVVQIEKPDWIVAQGDTTSVVAATLAAYYNRVNFGHIEAGLRTHDLYSPYPEEGNRLIADACAERLWAPTSLAAANLINEGYSDKRIMVTGNTVIDAIRFASAKAVAPAGLDHLKQKKFILVTVHRRESFGAGLLEICAALRTISQKFSDIDLVCPVHLNPNVHDVLHAQLAGVPNIHLLPPQEYMDFIWLMKNSFCVLTDSGGVQEEAPGLNIPVLVLRDKTERPEGIEAGVALIAGKREDEIVYHVTKLIADRDLYNSMASGQNPYGDGKAAQRIVEDIINAK